jgi:hypothetical protein
MVTLMSENQKIMQRIHIKCVIDLPPELELGGEIAQGSGHDTEKDRRG